jgi:penicillin-binding protein-related factor A (putative recombinase)
LAATVKEKVVVSQILTYLQSRGVFIWKNASVGIWDQQRKCFRRPVSKFQIKGVSDILGVYGGRFLAIEVKAKKGVVSKEQVTFLKAIRDRGGIAFVARSVEDVASELGI